MARPTLALALAAAAALTLSPPHAKAKEDPGPARAPAPRPAEGKPIDLAICLDTSGSMTGLIDATRRKLWQVVSDLATARPAPVLRVALLTFGSPGNDAAGHVVVQTDLTTDLDLVSERLFALSTNGGEEYVGRVVQSALDRLAWTRSDAAKILFVAGNESADQDTVAPFRRVVSRAAELGIRVNSIYCGGADDADAGGWREVAALGRGRFANIDQNDAVVAVATPFDERLATLSGRLNQTYVGYGALAGEASRRQEAQDANATAAAPGAAAERAVAKAGGLYRNSTWDLVDRSEEKDFDLAKVDAKDLPEEMRAMSLDERRAHLEKKRTERKAVQAEILELDRKRADFVKAEVEAKGLDVSKKIDRALRDAIREQAAAQGFVFDSAAGAK
jgi:hypothetical protein